MGVIIVNDLYANLTMQRGDTPTWRVPVFKSLNGVPTSEPFNLDGYRAWMTAKRAWTDADAAAVFQITPVRSSSSGRPPTASGM